MHIVIIDASVAMTGAFKAARTLATSLVELGHDVTILLPEGSGLAKSWGDQRISLKTGNMPMIRRSFGVFIYPIYLILAALRLRSFLRKYNVDIVISNDYYNLLGATAKCLGWRGKLVTFVRLIPSKQQAQLNRLWLMVAKNTSDKIVAVSRCVLQELPSFSGNTLLYDYCGLETEGYVTQIPPKRRNTIEFLYLANYIQGKGQDIALEGFTKAYQQNPNLTLRFVGGDMGLAKNRAYRDELKRKVRDYGLVDAVSFEGYQATVQESLGQCDVLLNCSSAESFSMTCLEASYMAKPVIATRCGGPSEIVSNGETGLLIDVGSVEQVADAILVLANDAETRHRMGLAGRARVEKLFSKRLFDENVARLVSELYERSIAH